MRLAADIQEAYIGATVILDPLEISRAKSRLEELQRIIDAIKKLDALIASDFFISATINKVDTPFSIPPIKRMLLDARTLGNELTLFANEWERTKADLSYGLKNRRPSFFEWFAGVSLPLVYERHFLRPAGRSRNAEGEPSGPMVRLLRQR